MADALQAGVFGRAGLSHTEAAIEPVQKPPRDLVHMDASTYSRSVQVRFEAGSGLLTLSFQGVVNRGDLDAGLAKIRHVTQGRAVNAVIIDARDSTPAYAAADLIESVEQTLDEIAPKRCAFVSGETRSEALMLIETVSFPYAVRVQAFSALDAARDWVNAAL
jgi:hypothetical protein